LHLPCRRTATRRDAEMQRRTITIHILLALALAVLAIPAQAADDPRAIVEKAIKALGGEEALGKAKAFSWKARTVFSLQGNEREGAIRVTSDGLNRYRLEFQDAQFTQIIVLNGDKAASILDGKRRELDKDAVAGEKQAVYMSVIPVTMLPLRDKAFKLESIAEDKVGEKPAVGIKVTPPDAKEFTLYFDKESGLPVKLAIKVVVFMNREIIQETTFSKYKDIGGIKKATRIEVESKLDGEGVVKVDITDFKVLDKVDARLFEG